jgi:hypothetical protein
MLEKDHNRGAAYLRSYCYCRFHNTDLSWFIGFLQVLKEEYPGSKILISNYVLCFFHFSLRKLSC